jgi:hypothetical protein
MTAIKLAKRSVPDVAAKGKTIEGALTSAKKRQGSGIHRGGLAPQPYPSRLKPFKK